MPADFPAGFLTLPPAKNGFWRHFRGKWQNFFEDLKNTHRSYSHFSAPLANYKALNMSSL
jgi:hypothetical protein